MLAEQNEDAANKMSTEQLNKPQWIMAKFDIVLGDKEKSQMKLKIITKVIRFIRDEVIADCNANCNTAMPPASTPLSCLRLTTSVCC